MKKSIVWMGVIIWVCVGIVASPCLAADVVKIGVVDSQKFFKESDIGKAANAQVEKEYAKLKADLETAGQQLKTIEQALERADDVMKDDKREEKEREFRIKKYDFQVMQQKYAESVRKVNQDMIIKLNKKITKLTQEFGSKEGFLLLIEKEYTVYYPSAIDVTDKLIAFANAKKLTLDEKE